MNTRCMVRQIGSSSPCRSPSRTATGVVRTPSAVMIVPASTSSSLRPLPSCSPTCRLRLYGLRQVLSPTPSPSAMPAAIATTFFNAPPSSQPITSPLV
nr:hypothetical protein [Nonomuraea sp. PA05]